MTIRNLDLAFRPKSVAFIGATARPGSAGAVIMRNLRGSGFRGEIWLVNPRYTALDGAPCYPSAAALPGAPDLAVIATPPETVPQIIAELGKAGCRAALVITAGITDENGLKQKMLDAAKPFLLRIIGPNSLGLFVPERGLNASFAHLAPQKGQLAFLSQSGALTGAILDWAANRHIGFSHVASMGDMADVDVGDMLDYLAGDIRTKAILLYLETITNPRKFMSAARSAARVKPVVAVKAGRHSAGAKAAHTHTGALAGSNEAFDAALKRAGLLRVEELEELFDAAEALTRLKPPAGDRLTILTNGGGAGVLAVDKLMDFGGALSELSPDIFARLDAALPPTWSRANPVDIIGDAGPERYEAALDAILDDAATDAVLVMNCPTGLASSTDAAKAVLACLDKRRAQKRPEKPILTNWLGSQAPQKAREMFAEAGIATYESPDDAVRGFHYLNAYRKLQEKLMRTPPSLPGSFSPNAAAAQANLKAALTDERTMLSEPEAKAVFEAYGIPTVQTEIAKDAGEAEAIARRLFAYTPLVALKILSPDISHKSDVGGVALNLQSPADVRQAAERMLERIRRLRPQARNEGFTVQPMISRPGAHELILGVAQDQIFGPVIIFGAGGAAVEVIKDKAVALPPLDLKLARDLMAETRIFKLLQGYRDHPAADLDAIALALVRLSHLIADFPVIEELDVNPLLADQDGVLALDARIKINPGWTALKAPNPRFAIRPYPSEWEKNALTHAGRHVFLRPILPSDEPAYGALLSRVTPEDIRSRFFAPLKEFSHGFLARFTQIDYARAMAFVAIDPPTGDILGAARLTADPDYSQAEYGVLVRSDLKGQGMGWVLMEQLIAYARAEGIGELYGDVLSGNTVMLGMCRELGFDIKRHAEDAAIFRVTLRLNAPTEVKT